MPFLASQKPQKPHHGPFQSRLALIHTPRTQGHCPGCLLRKPLDGIDRRPKALAAFASGSVFGKAQRFNAGWSSPVARQAHNLKVIGSNPIPATKLALPGHRPGRVFLWGRRSRPSGQSRAGESRGVKSVVAIRRRFAESSRGAPAVPPQRANSQPANDCASQSPYARAACCMLRQFVQTRSPMSEAVRCLNLPTTDDSFTTKPVHEQVSIARAAWREWCA